MPAVLLSCSDDDDDTSKKGNKTEEPQNGEKKVALTDLEGAWLRIGADEANTGVYFANSVTSSADSVLFMDYVRRSVPYPEMPGEIDDPLNAVFLFNGKEYAGDSCWAYQFDFKCTAADSNSFSYQPLLSTVPAVVEYQLAGDTLTLVCKGVSSSFVKYKGRSFMYMPLLD